MLIGAKETEKGKKCIFTKPGLPKVFTHLASVLPLPALPKAGCVAKGPGQQLLTCNQLFVVALWEELKKKKELLCNQIF